jgi:hypothetical protein
MLHHDQLQSNFILNKPTIPRVKRSIDSKFDLSLVCPPCFPL